MKKIIGNTRLEPDNKIEQIKSCLELFYDKTEKKIDDNEEEEENKNDKKVKNENDKKNNKKSKKNKENLNTIINDKNNSSNLKRKYYGIEFEKINKPIKPYYITQPTFTNGKKNNLSFREISRVMPVGREEMNLVNWICLYSKSAERKSYSLLKGLIKCSEGCGLEFKNNNSNWIPMINNSPDKWIKIVEEELNYRKECKLVIFLIDSDNDEKDDNNNDELYIKLKKHSLCDNGYISQVIKSSSLYKKGKKGIDSVYSKILLQINNKLGGFNYFLNTDSLIEDRKFMLIGIDSSHIWGRIRNQRTGIAMVSTKDKQFSKFYTTEEILRTDENYASEKRRIIQKFIKEAYDKYLKENKEPPKNIIIYRQGIAHNQLKFVEFEAKLIDITCKDLKLNYYYVIVNTSTNVKFFEYNYKNDINKNNIYNYKNPEQGLVILDQITDKKRFEFYIQPQKVNIGSATPTYFHVAYGNMIFPELLIQLTYWTTYLYSNWQNAVRVPHVIKMAEKLAYMTAKYTQAELNEKLYDKQSFL